MTGYYRMCLKSWCLFFLLLFLIYGKECLAQGRVIEDTTPVVQKSFRLNALIVGRYSASLNENIDVTGKHFYSQEEGIVSNSFEMQYVRLSTTFGITDRITSSILLNLADFKHPNVSEKVLENAFINYSYNPYLNLRFGQFRPFFGLEDLHPFQLNNSYAWSNQYSLFGRNGWQSFQLGAAFFGSLAPVEVPLYYYFTVYNGNNKNQLMDSDSSKNYTLRIEYYPFSVLKLGINGGTANYNKQRGYAFGLDAQLRYSVSNRLDFDMNVEYKKGTNFLAYRSSLEEHPDLNMYKMEGIYSLYQLRYYINKPRIRALELSFRHEYLNSDTTIPNNDLNSYVPVISMVFANMYDVKLSLVGVINNYQDNIPNSAQYDHSRVLMQLQVAY
ncbi:porin [Salegentibacter sp. F188]|uniref:Porin n=1 Tax=Autumnicola patrickiae TaxID=3075591 RepID=A0ABU3E4T6_9FLAO|nr:porin [Salegentibacter sp. F188]MDT0690984.1 porin [Salegentibacter sp. F188]